MKDRSTVHRQPPEPMNPRTEPDTSTHSTDQVVAEAARLFNQLGYAVSSLELVERELRLQAFPDDQFGDGEALARAAFDFAADAADRVLREAVESEESTVEQLRALIAAFRRFVDDPPVEGGSPVFHAAVQSHHAFPFLEERARDVVAGWRHCVRRIVRRGIKLGEIHPSALPDTVASILVGTMEGAIFLHRIDNDTAHLDRSVDYLLRYIERDVEA